MVIQMTRAASFSGPAYDYVPVGPSDTSDLGFAATSLYVEVGGDVCFVARSGQERTVAVPDFSWILCVVTAVRETGTTASKIHALTVG